MNGNAAIYFVDRHVDEGRADKVAFREADGRKRSLTYGALAEQTGRFAGALYRHGVRREERIAMIVQDQVEFPVIFWGALKAGAIPVPLNTLLSASVYESILGDSRASILVVSEKLWETVKPAIQDNRFLRAVVVIGEAPEGTESYQDFIAGAPVEDPVEAFDDEMAFWLYSSGSTGQPKGVRHVHSSLKATADTFGAQVLGIREEDTVYSVAKIFFAYGLGNAMSFPMAVGATTVLLSGRPTPDVVFAILEAERPTLFCGVPTLYAAMNAAMDKSGVPAHAMRLCTSAGEALPKEVGERWFRMTGAEIVDGVGSTEMLHIFLSNRPGEIVYGTSGTPVPGYEVRLVDEHDEDVPEGEVGELLVRGPSAADGYWNRRHKSRSTFEGHWTRTGDKYECTAEGRYVYCGRTDDMFKVSGIWVSPFEVEQALIEHPAVLEAAVVACADEKGLDKPKAFIVLKEGQEAAAVDGLKEFVKEKIGMWKYPRWIEVVEDLPKTATGKIQRFKLRGAA
ncbi:4-hydroxybenzoate-CoA ligase [Mameliella alba]|uniref:benzoate-CoA ligase family protein n=1 Tax=Mameliella alba TaxID=561184 RepID=UPI0008815AA5|nr:benzoate-CoA ligase family protein [Mameliella alba]OWV48207.1 benzoate-CoA ligase family protein [Mameliella alba]PTR40242.1 benzoate-CoA ligase [Mameliella alba]GGF43399.1 acetyl-CoA synthetase [Mameliella alba]SDC96839.1 4-hydroxybenzoate-CoA ligase [Mameliella alba]